MGDLDKSLEFCKRVLNIERYNSSGLHNLSAIFYERGLNIKALLINKLLVKIYPNDSVAWNNLGHKYFISREFCKAIHAHKISLEINPKNVTCWKNLAYCYGNIGDWREAERCFEKGRSPK